MLTWQAGPTGPWFLGEPGAATGPVYFGPTGATAPQGPTGATGPFLEDAQMQHLFDRARAGLVGASDAIIRATFYDVFYEFFNDSSCWQELIFGQIMPDKRFYVVFPIEFPPGIIVRAMGAFDKLGFPIAMDFPQIAPGGGVVMQLQCPLSNETTVIVKVIKNIAIPTARTGYMPDVPFWAPQLYERGLLCGLLSKLQMQKDRPYSDPKLSVVNGSEFRRVVVQARVAAQRRNTHGTNVWSYPQQFKTSSQRGTISVGNSFQEF